MTLWLGVLPSLWCDDHFLPLSELGTMVVQPEAVVEKRPAFKGPEFKTRKRNPGELDMLMCSACNKQINPNVPGSARRHPVLKVLICKVRYVLVISTSL